MHVISLSEKRVKKTEQPLICKELMAGHLLSKAGRCPQTQLRQLNFQLLASLRSGSSHSYHVRPAEGSALFQRIRKGILSHRVRTLAATYRMSDAETASGHEQYKSSLQMLIYRL